MKEKQNVAHSEIGMVMHCDRHELVLPKLAEYGYSHVHFARFSSLRPEELRSISERCNKLGLKPFSAHGPSTFLPGDVSVLGEMIEKHKRAIDQAAILGVGSITFHLASVEGTRDNDSSERSAKKLLTR